MIRLSELKLNEANPRVIKDDKFKKLVESIKSFPQMMELRPIVVDEMNVIQGGNMRYRALVELGYQEVPDEWVKQGKELTPEQWREFVIKDNVGFGEWDFDMLANDWDAEELQDWGLDLPVDFGGTPEAQEDDYEIPDEIETDIVRGDLFEIGEHRLMCGDSTSAEDVEKLMGGAKCDMVFTDPPYNVNYGADVDHPSWGNKRGDRTIANDKMSAKDFTEFIKSSFTNIKTHCDGVIYCFGAQGADGRIMFTVLDNMFHNSGTIIWLKDSLVLGRGKYHTKYEPCWFGWNKSGETFTDDRTLTNVWEIKRPKVSDLHPTMKPIELIGMGLNHNPKAKSVMDLFMGSGSTMVAAHQLNRRCYGMEIDPKYCQVIIDRMLKLDPTIKIKRNGEDYERTEANIG